MEKENVDKLLKNSWRKKHVKIFWVLGASLGSVVLFVWANNRNFGFLG